MRNAKIDRQVRTAALVTAVLGLCVTGLFFLLKGSGNRRPPNPGVQVMENAPNEVNSVRFAEVKFEVNGQLIDDHPLQLTSEEKLSFAASLINPPEHSELRGMTTMWYIRLMPAGTSEYEWSKVSATWEFSDQYVGPINWTEDRFGSGEVSYVVKALPGFYDVRCYLSIHRPIEEAPEFYLLAEGRVEITATQK